MARKSEEWWAAHESPATVRCIARTRDDRRCLREAEAGSIVCRTHGSAAPQVRRRAAERIIYTADEAAQNLVKWMNDGNLPWGERVKIARDLMDRAGLAAAQVHKIVPVETDDPVESLFKSLLGDPDGLMPTRPDAHPALESGEAVQGQVLDPAQEAVDRLEESWQPDADVRPLRPGDVGTVGPYDYRGKEEPKPENGNPKPAPPVPGWRPPDDAA